MNLRKTVIFLAFSSMVWSIGACSTQPPIQETVRFESGDATLEGLLDIPTTANGRVPLAVFVHGSGRATRNDYAAISARLNVAGFATFRYDKRGVGQSGGIFNEVGTWNSEERIGLLASDAAAAIAHLRTHARINREKIIVIGGSQAGWIIPVVSGLTDVSATVCISGPTVSVGEEIFYSELAEDNSHTQDHADQLLATFRGQRGFDNISHVARMSHPSLWIFGGKDVSIPVKKCIARLDSLKNASRLPVELKIYPEGDHGIYNRRGQLEDYTTVIIDWLKLNINR